MQGDVSSQAMDPFRAERRLEPTQYCYGHGYGHDHGHGRDHTAGDAKFQTG